MFGSEEQRAFRLCLLDDVGGADAVVKFDAEHEAETADAFDFRQGSERLAQRFAFACDCGEEGVIQAGKDGKRAGAADRVAAEG